MKIVSLSVIYSDDLVGGYSEENEFEILSGLGHYSETLSGLTFNVSPFAFFQVNTPVFEKILNEISNFAKIDQNTVLLDVCCGTGAIGLCLSKNAKKVIGIDIISAAIENAKKNIELNEGLLDKSKLEFYAGRAEDLLPSIVNRESQSIQKDL